MGPVSLRPRLCRWRSWTDLGCSTDPWEVRAYVSCYPSLRCVGYQMPNLSLISLQLLYMFLVRWSVGDSEETIRGASIWNYVAIYRLWESRTTRCVRLTGCQVVRDV